MKSHHRAFFTISAVIILLALVAFFGLQNSQTKNDVETFSGFIRSFDPYTATIFVSSLNPEVDPLLKRFTLSNDASITTLVAPNSATTHKISFNEFNIEYLNADTKIANFPFEFESRGTVITKMVERYTP